MTHSIADAARHTGLTIDTLRYYERIELLDPPTRDSAGRRRYSDEDLRWIGFLTKLRSSGMSISRMREYASSRHDGPESAGRRKAILEEQRRALVERMAELRDCLELLDVKIGDYERIERTVLSPA